MFKKINNYLKSVNDNLEAFNLKMDVYNEGHEDRLAALRAENKTSLDSADEYSKIIATARTEAFAERQAARDAKLRAALGHRPLN